MILAGDIGGTKTVLALFDEGADGIREVRSATFKSQGYADFADVLAEFLSASAGQQLKAGCIGVAGAIIDGVCRTTNLPWVLDERVLGAKVGLDRVKLLNDLEAAAFGMLFLAPNELHVLNPGDGKTPPGNKAVIAAGTGLGEAMLYWDGRDYHPLASEGGHSDFAPRTDQEIELLQYLRTKFPEHVSYERVLSGPGVFNVYSFLRDTKVFPEPDWLAAELASGDPSATVSKHGLSKRDPLCTAALELFCTIYGAEAGNMALNCVAVGGVYVGGGIAPKILPALAWGGFLKAYTAKGRFSEYVSRIPLLVGLNPRAPLLGAAHYARRLAAS